MKIAFSSINMKSLLSSRIISRFIYQSTTPSSRSSLLIPNNDQKKKENLQSRIIPAGEPWVSMVPILNQWVEEGNNVTKGDIVSIIKRLRGFKRFKHALQISQWMSDEMCFELQPGDMAVRLGLISSVHGIEQAEKYFGDVAEQSKILPVYYSLLECYAHNNSTEKAESLMQQMKEIGFVNTPVAYNILLNLYYKLGQYEKQDALIQEMNERGVVPDTSTYSIRLASYADTAQINDMESILRTMEKEPKVVMNWHTYGTAANGYMKAGKMDKALEFLKKSEELIPRKKKKFVYHYLLTMYASAGKKDELYRIWNVYKSTEKVYNMGYRCMISSLIKLGDIAAAEKILEEWEYVNTSYDFRVPNLLVAAYCKNGLLDKAEMLVQKAVEKGKEPLPTTWEILATTYNEFNQIQKAVEAVKNALLAKRPGWRPKRPTLGFCLLYLKQQGEDKKIGELLRLLGVPVHMSGDDCERLLDYIYGGEEATMDADSSEETLEEAT
ncbi:hypothetical protein ACHQM5_017342 [Ranunculus cassubicifolius]